MAAYLPVLLVSVTSNPSVDDSSLETLPRGQVDYLSHEWTEEDVWRSWRNMTRQKNEIANGVRLENASWRTWWKQRNKLKTVTPETLNWLKDSDVTWLYGPLHTAVDWTPPPKPKPDPTSVDKDVPNSALDRLDLSTSAAARRASAAHETKHKSILKYRSISELLTSELPASIMGASPRFGMSPQESDGEVDPDDAQVLSPKRPPLSQTKSDTHVTIGSPGKQVLAAMGLRRDSPPRVGLTDHVQLLTSPSIAAHSSGDSSDLAQESSPSESVSPDSRVNPAPHDITSDTHGRHKKKQKHIAFNTFVEQCIAIEKPKNSHLDRPKSSQKPKKPRPGLGYETSGNWNGKTQGMRWDGVEEDEDEDEEHVVSDVDFDDSSESDDGAAMDHPSYMYYPYPQSSWYSNECAIDSSEESDAVDDEAALEDVLGDNDGDDGVTEMRTSRQTSQKPLNRSQSRVSDSSNSSTFTTSTSALSTTSTAETSPSPARESGPKPLHRRRQSRKSVPEHPSHHRLSTSSQSSNATIIARRKSFSHHGNRLVRKESSSTHNHMTIAPIAPTILKTTGVGNGWDGFGSGYGHQYRPSHLGDWMDGFGDDGYSDDGGAMRWYPGKWPSGDGNSSSDIETPVELVYVPPGGRYTGTSRYGNDDGDNEGLDKEYHHQEAYFSMDDASQQRRSTVSAQPVPVVVRTPASGVENDNSDHFAGPTFGFVQSPRRVSGSRSASRSEDSREEDTQRPSRSTSRSRTPSPIINETAAVIVPDRALTLSPTLLSPPLRGRTLSQQQEEHTSRGRSSKRTSPSSLSDRERSAQTSPFGSLSPDAPAIGLGAYGVYANGRIDRERVRERERGQVRKDRERGRERTERRLNHTHSSSSPGGSDVTDGTVSSPSLSISPPASTSGPSQKPREALMDVSYTTANSIMNGPAPESLQRQPPSPSSPTSPVSPLGPSTSTPARSSSIHTSKAIKEADGTFVGKAIGMMSSTGAYFGLWPTDSRT